MKSASREQRTTVMTDASGPKAPPVISSGPQTVGSNTLAVFADPETLKPNTFPWVKFQAQWIPMGSHREPEYLKATPNRTPASMAIATELHTVALGWKKWAKPNRRAETARAHHRPNRSSIILNRIPLKISSSEQATYKK